MAIQNDLNIQKNIINGVVESNDWDPYAFEEKNIMLDLSNYTYNTYADSYRNSSRTLSAGIYLINAKVPHTSYGITIGNNGYLVMGNGEWIKIKINDSTSVKVETFNSDNYNYYYFWKQN